MGNFSKKIASTVSMTAIVASAMSASLVSAASEFAPYAEALANHNVINKQTTEAGYRLGDNITRAELAKVAANLGGYTSVACSGTVYSDVKQNLGDLCDAIETLAAAGVVTKANATFRPNANVTRAEMTKMLVGAVGGTPSTVDAGYADTANLGDLTGFINKAREMGAIGAATNFRPNANGSRGEVFKIAAKVANIEVPNIGDTTNPTPTPSQTGSVSVSAVGSPAAQYVPKNASSVKVGTVKLMANGGDATIRSLVVSRSGLGNPSDIESSNGIRLSIDGKIVSSNSNYYNEFDQTGNIFFSPALTLKKGESVDADVLVSLSGSANSQHQFAVTKVNNTVITPVTLGLINTTSYEATKVEASLTNKASNLNPGTNQQRIVDVQLSSSDREVKITGFNVTRANISGGNYDLTKLLTNVKVFLNGTEVGKATVTADKIYVTGLDTLIKSGRKNFQLRADVLLDTTATKLGLKIEDSSDVSGVETSTNQVFRVEPKTETTEINLRAVKTAFVSNGSSTQKVSAYANNLVTLYDATFSSDVPVKIKEIQVAEVTSAGVKKLAAADINGDKLYILNNGSRIATVKASEVLAASTSVGKTVTIPHIFVSDSSKANLTIEGQFEASALDKESKFKITLSEITDMANRPADIRTKSQEGVKTTIEGATVDVISKADTNSTRIAKNNTYRLGFALKARTEAATLTEIIFHAKDLDLTKIIDGSDLNNRVKVEYNGQEEDTVVTLENSNKDIKVVFNAPIDLAKDANDENFALKFETKDFSGVNETVQFSVKSLTAKAQNASVVQTADKNVNLGRVYSIGSEALTLSATAITDNSNNVVRLDITNNSSEAIDLTKINISAGAIRGTDSVVVTGLSLADTENSTATTVAATTGSNKFEFADLDNLTIKQIPANSTKSVYISVENLPYTDATYALVLNSLTYGGSDDNVRYSLPVVKK